MKHFLVVSCLFLSACGVDIESGRQLAGQTCFVPSDCVAGLTCFERRCTPTPVGSSSSNDQSASTNQTHQDDENNLPDMGHDSPTCIEGPSLCLDESTVQSCVNGAWTYELCPETSRCFEGYCVRGENCQDQDRDGYAVTCNGSFDCDDANALVNPGRMEVCGNGLDDNCNGAVDDHCGECCAGGCPNGTFCDSTCTCSTFEPDVCRFQNQPCTDIESFVNGYYCVDLLGSGQGYCFGVCSQNAMNPDATCPDPNSACALGGDGNSGGLCVSNCDVGQGCGDPSLSCMPLGYNGNQGSCVPSNPSHQAGDACDVERFLDCADGLICVPRANGNAGVCREVCRPFETDASGASDCSVGHCYPYQAAFGVCLPDNNSAFGEQCSPQLSMCNEDAVACFPAGFDVNRCQRLCRIDKGDSDCQGQTCTAVSTDQTEIGVCRPGF